MAEFSLYVEGLSLTPEYYPEVWKAIPGFEDEYIISSWGRIASIRGCMVRNGYKFFSLPYPEGRKNRPLAPLILESFGFPKPSEGHVARHLVINDPSNNYLWNLAWGTQQENIDDKLRHGTIGKIFTEDDVRDIWMRLTQGESITSIARSYGTHVSAIHRIKSRRSWEHLTSKLPGKPKEVRLSESAIKRVLGLLEEGMSAKEISRRLRLHRSTIYKIAKKHAVHVQDQAQEDGGPCQ
jgi:hypothetical protein